MNNCSIKNNSNLEIDNEIFSLVDFAKERFGFKYPPSIFLNQDQPNSEKILAKTGYYDPETMEIHIYTTGRHPKDILRSIAHELVHHYQNEKGQFENAGYSGKGYAQKNKHLRNMELQANDPMLFRDWEDYLKENQPTIYNERRNKNMSTKQWKNQELNKLLLEKFGIKEYGPFGSSKQNPKKVKGFKQHSDNQGEKKEKEKKQMETKQTLCEPHCATEEDKQDLMEEKCPKCEQEPCVCPDKDKKMEEEKKGKYDDGDDKDEKCDYVDCEDKEESTKEWKDRTLSESLTKKWGFSMNLNKLKK